MTSALVSYGIVELKILDGRPVCFFRKVGGGVEVFLLKKYLKTDELQSPLKISGSRFRQLHNYINY